MNGLKRVEEYIIRRKVKTVNSGDQNLAFWDAQLKAILAHKLQGVEFQQFVHDVDYLSKVRNPTAYRFDHDGDGYAAVPHNSTFTLDIWTAAFEIMSLFGGEVIVDPFELREHQYPWKLITKSYPKLIDEITQAFGWRGIVNIAGNDIIAGEITPKALEDEVKEIVEFAIMETKKIINHSQVIDFKPLYAIQETIINDGLTLKNAYLKAFTESLKLFFGCIPENIKLSSSSDFLKFNTDTCFKPRFEILDIFVNPETKDLAINAYNKAVEGTGIVTLDKFGEGAIPFDLYIPEIGRGTLHCLSHTTKELYIVDGLNDRSVVIATITLKNKPNVYNIAEALEEKFGKNISLVGKAITLPLMLLNEAPIVLNEKGSSYFPQVHKLCANLKKHNIPLILQPVLRTVFNSLDAIHILKDRVVFKLPEHLVFISGQTEINAESLSIKWRSWVERARLLYANLLTERSPEKILQIIIGHYSTKEWLDLYREYLDIKKTFANRIERESLGKEEKENLKQRKKHIEDVIQREKLCVMCYCKKVEALELFNYRTPWWCLLLFGQDWLNEVKNNASVYLEEF